MTQQGRDVRAMRKRVQTEAGIAVPALFAGVVTLSAGLLFFVQPLAAKLALPYLGGAAAVWTTAMLFFQAVLLAGYGYAHLLATRTAPAAQVGLHLLVLAAGLAVLPIAVPAGWTVDPGSDPAIQTLVFLGLAVGLPFFALAANAPLIQAWYARTGARHAADPYHLYAASNAGSLVALLGFPLVAEPLFGARVISGGWAAAYVALIAGMAACGWASLRGAALRVAAPRTGADSTGPRPATLLHWAALGFVPSSLLLGATSIVTTDLGSFPLLWVIPLALFLLTFVIGFSRWYRPRPETSARIALACVLALAVPALLGVAFHLKLAGFGFVLGGFFVIALHCHAQLYALRPAAAHLTPFYFAMSVGGVCGGLFNSLLAPALFDSHAEFEITLILAAFVIAAPLVRGLRTPLVWGGAASAAAILCYLAAVNSGLAARIGSEPKLLGTVLYLFAVAATLLRPPAVAVAILVTGGFVATLGGDTAVLRDRSFFGAYEVIDDPEAGTRTLRHGTTIHGVAALHDLDAPRPVPLSYYHETGPMARALALLADARAQVGVVGLGVGSLACHAGPGQRWTFFEIDPLVDRIARDPALFPFMPACGAAMPTLLGDARIELQRMAGPRFDMLVIDAYSSDAVPVHLTTLEAMELYLDRLAADGAIVFHISNRYYDLERVLAGAAGRLGLAAVAKLHVPGPDAPGGTQVSHVVALARDAERLDALVAQDGWARLDPARAVLWTDDSASPLAVLRR